MFDNLLEKIQRVDEIESKLLSIFEGKSWEYIAKALYTILDDIDTASDMCKDNYKAYQDVVMKLQAKKNQYLTSDGYTLKPVDEIDSDSEEEPANSMLQPDEDEDIPEDGVTCALMKYNATANESVKENLTDHARRELELAGMFDKEVEGSEAAGSWNTLCAEAVMELMEVFAEQGHSGFSASMTQDLFSRLSKYEALTELTDNIDEWNDISEMQSGEPGWQSQRNPSCFSDDNGKTYWDISEEYYLREDEEDGMVYSGGLSKEEWTNRPMHQSKHIGKEE